MTEHTQEQPIAPPPIQPATPQPTWAAGGYWAGYASGASQGPLIAWVDEAAGFRARVLFGDAAFGSSFLSLIGQRLGDVAFLTIDHVHTVAPAAQLGSIAWLDMRQRGRISGVTFVPAGFVNLQLVPLGASCWNPARWYWRRACTWLFTNGPSIYFVVLLSFFLAHSLGRILPSLSWIDLVLLLIPAPILFQRAMARLLLFLSAQSALVLANLGARKITVGPLDLEVAKIAPRAESFNKLRYMIGPFGELVLFWLHYEDPLPQVTFNNRLTSLASLMGMPGLLTGTPGPIPSSGIGLYVSSRITALGLASSDKEELKLTKLGREFIQYLLGSGEENGGAR